MYWKKTGLLAIILAALAIVADVQPGNAQPGNAQPGKVQPGSSQRARSANLQVSTGYLGVGVQDLDPERIKSLKLKETAGVEVSMVFPGAPAEKAGIRVGDIILEVNGQKVEGREQFAASVGGNSPGAKVTLNIWRDGSKQNIEATLGRQALSQLPFGLMMPMPSEDFQALFAGDAWKVGFEGEPLTPQLAAFFGAPEGEGVLVRTVVEKSPADKAGLKAGDVVIKVNAIPVSRPGEIVGIVRQSKKATFTVIRNKKEVTLNVEIARNSNPFEPEGFGNN